jgi:hypothetical protein
MSDKKVRIDEELLIKIKQFRKDKERALRYPSDKHLVQMAVLELFKKEANEEIK